MSVTSHECNQIHPQTPNDCYGTTDKGTEGGGHHILLVAESNTPVDRGNLTPIRNSNIVLSSFDDLSVSLFTIG